VADELAFYRSTENIPVDVEMLRALRPCLATTGGKLIVLSSPYGSTGALYDLRPRGMLPRQGWSKVLIRLVRRRSFER
jgi:hypothetical protein